MNKIEAFTVIELIIGMIISTIVLGISFYALIIFSTEIKRYSRKTDSINTFLLFKETIYRDLDHSSCVKASMNGTNIYGQDQNGNALEYLFDSNKIIRNSELERDTFNLSNKLTRLTEVSDELKLIKLLQCDIHLDGQIIQFTIQKDYTASELIKEFGTI